MNLETVNYQPSYQPEKKPEVTGSNAFNLELYGTPPAPGELRRDIISYLGEYRLQVPKYSYDLIFGRDKNREGAITLRDIDRGEDLQIKAKKASVERLLRGVPNHREKAEEIGLNRLQQQLDDAKSGHTILWGSPPGPKEQGYGEYGFMYAGKVTKLADGEAHLAMSAIRLEKPRLKQYNRVLSILSSEIVSHRTAEEFLAAPKLIPYEIPTSQLDRILKNHFSFTADEEKQKKFTDIIGRMKPIIDDFIAVMHNVSKEEKLKAFYALENYALKLKNEESTKKPERHIVYQPAKRLHNIVDAYGYKPPVAAGSCGSTGESSKSNGLISFGGGEVANSAYGTDKYGSRSFTCPSCHQTNIRPLNGLVMSCQHCGSIEVAC